VSLAPVMPVKASTSALSAMLGEFWGLCVEVSESEGVEGGREGGREKSWDEARAGVLG
jgi:hypothetical protein